MHQMPTAATLPGAQELRPGIQARQVARAGMQSRGNQDLNLGLFIKEQVPWWYLAENQKPALS